MPSPHSLFRAILAVLTACVVVGTARGAGELDPKDGPDVDLRIAVEDGEVRFQIITNLAFLDETTDAYRENEATLDPSEAPAAMDALVELFRRDIEVKVDGAVVAVLPGTATFTTAAALGAGIHEICVIGKIGGIEVGPPACCTVGFALPGPITGVTCFPIVGAVGTGVSWANDGLYDAIEVVVDGSIVAVLPGNATTTVLPQLTGWTSVCLVPWVGNLAIEPIDCCENPTLEQTFIRADVNFDGGFDISDAIALLTFLFSGGMAPPCEDAADVNDDAAINVGDAIYALSTLFTGGAPPPAPFPACGADPTADGLGCAIFPPCP